MNDDDEEFEKNLELLRMAYSEKPKNTIIELRELLERLHMDFPDDDSLFQEPFQKNYSFFFAIFIGIIMTSLIGLLQNGEFGVYLFGEIFFFAGLGMGLYVPAFGLIFLFSHGGTGYFMMLELLLRDCFSNPIWSDNPLGLYLYMGVMIAIFIVAVIFTIFHNLSSSMKNNKKYFFLIAFLYIFVLFMAGIFPHISQYLIYIHF